MRGGILERLVLRVFKNRWGYTDEELAAARRTGLADAIGFRDLAYWIKAEPVLSRHCMGGNYEGRPLYFDAMGGLIRRKCPPSICVHGLSQLSPLIYSYYDHMLRGEDPNRMVFHTVTCTDPGLEWGGLGSCTFRLSRERMPLHEFLLHNMRLLPYLFVWNRRQRGRGGTAGKGGERTGTRPADFMLRLPMSRVELEAFLAVPERERRLRAMERFEGRRIVIRVVESLACPAGHAAGEEIFLDCAGRVLRDETGRDVCIMALHKAWFRVMLLLERMAQGAESEEEPDLTGPLFDIPISCFGGAWPLGACGRILMRVEVRSVDGVAGGGV